MKREILVRLDITGATDTHCVACITGIRELCPWGEMIEGDKRLEECIAAEKEAKANEDAKCDE